MNYHVTITDSYWKKRYPEWSSYNSLRKQELMGEAVEQIRRFLSTDSPATECNLLVTSDDVRVVPEDQDVRAIPLKRPATGQALPPLHLNGGNAVLGHVLLIFKVKGNGGANQVHDARPTGLVGRA